MKFVVACKENGLSKAYKVDDEHKWGQVMDLKIGSEFDAEKILGEAYKGYVLRVCGGTDNDGFPMKNGVLKKSRVKLLIAPRTCGLRKGRQGERKRKSVRGAIVDRDIGTLHVSIVSKGSEEITGFTDVKTPRRLGPKRANKIRKLFGLPRHSDRIHNKEKGKVAVDRFDVTRYIVKRPSKTVGDKQYMKAPKIQRLITSQRLRRKRDKRRDKLEAVTANNKEYSQFIERLRTRRADRQKKEQEATATQPAQTVAPTAGKGGKTVTSTTKPGQPAVAARQPGTKPATAAAGGNKPDPKKTTTKPKGK